jgi:methylmalonyl-CoA mutase cobalamin-binding subunit
VGGAPTGDRYVLPSLSAATVLAAEGFHAVNLGPHTPIAAVRRAIDHHRARLVWISISHVEDAPALRAELELFVRELGPRGIKLVLGGREHTALALETAPHVFPARTMGELVAYARGVLAGP